MQQPNAPRMYWVVVVSTLAGLIGGSAAGGLVGYFASRMPAPVVSGPPLSATTAILAPKGDVPVVDAIRKVRPAVVTIVNVGMPTPGVAGTTVTTVLSGSGLIFDPTGLVVTNNHVVQRSEFLQVYFGDGTKTDGTVIGTDSVFDIAVIRVNEPVPAAVPLGNSSGLELGQTVIAIGSPVDQYPGTTTVGVISGLDRRVGGMTSLIQTDASINSGNSGGPLLSSSGEVIGINTLVVRSTADGKTLEGLGFAIPSDLVRRIVAQLVSKGNNTPAYVGVGYQEIDLQVASAMNLGMVTGVVITQIEAASPAAQAGVQERDVILEIDGQNIDRNHLFPDVLSKHRPGDTITLTILRRGESLELKLVLGRRPFS